MMEDYLEVDINRFTVFVFSLDLTNGFAKSYIEKYRNSYHYIKNDYELDKFISSVFETIEKCLVPIANVVAPFFGLSSGAPVVFNNNFADSSTQLLTFQDHKAVDLDDISPIIIAKKNISNRFLNKLANIFYNSPIKPIIIILENTNNLISEKYSNFPTNTLIKYLDNSLKITESIVINKGANSLDLFMTSLSDRCFDTCANTNTNLLLNEDIINENIVAAYTVPLLKVHTNLMYDRKEIVGSRINSIITELENNLVIPNKDESLIKFYLCISLINRIFCNDYGGDDIINAFNISKELNNDILKSHIYRYCDFLPNISSFEKTQFFLKAEKTFRNHNMIDHAMYCVNNNYTDSFSTNIINSSKFENLVNEAKEKVPGMCGLVHLINNTGVSFIYEKEYLKAIQYFDDGINRITTNDRVVQKIALKINKMISLFCMTKEIYKDEIIDLMNEIQANIDNNLEFIKARYYMNLVSMAFQCDKNFGNYLIGHYKINNVVNSCIENKKIGAEQLQQQIKFLQYFPGFPYGLFTNSNSINSLIGKRMEFISLYGLNPFHFKTWL